MKRSIFVLCTLLIACASPPILPVRTAGADLAGEHRSEHAFNGKDGLALYAQSWRPAGEPRAVLVIVHGLKDHGARYGDFANELTAKGFAVHAADLRGHGRSAGERVWVENFDDYLDDLDVFLASVKKTEGDKPIFVMGHSMGGAIVTKWAIDRKPHVNGVVLSAPAITAHPGWFTRRGIWLANGLAPHSEKFQLEIDKFSRDPAVVAACKADPLVFQDPAPVHTARQLLNALDHIDDHMEDLELPFFVMHGTADEITEPDGSKELARRAKSADKTLKIYPGLVHDLLHEPEKRVVREDVEAWLEAHAH